MMRPAMWWYVGMAYVIIVRYTPIVSVFYGVVRA
jgi:hypothetical protein